MLCGDDSDDEVAGPSQFARIATAASQAGFASEELELTLSGAPRDGSPSVAFCDLTYSIAVPAQGDEPAAERTILEGATGVFCARELTALMGPSGAGKTTLLDILAGRKRGGALVAGDVRIAGVAPTPTLRKRFTGYCEQVDTLIDVLTVEEQLLYTAELKLPAGLPAHVKAARVAELVAELGLGECARTPIGNVLARTISGGQAKRCNIGVALIAQPPILLLDEPTTGLDSCIAQMVTDALRRIATARSRAALARLLLPARWDPPPTPNAVAPAALGA